jgi:hypothetical protein
MMNGNPVMFPWSDLVEPDMPEIRPIPELTLEEVKIAMMFAGPWTLLGQTVARDYPGAKNWRVKGYPMIGKWRRRKSKAAYRNNPANKPKIAAKIKECKAARREAEYAHNKRWRENNPDKVKAQKARADREYDARSIVCIDSEGKFAGKTIMTNEGLAKEQRTFLWGAASATSKPAFLCHDTRGRLAHMKYANGFARCLENSGKRIS